MLSVSSPPYTLLSQALLLFCTGVTRERKLYVSRGRITVANTASILGVVTETQFISESDLISVSPSGMSLVLQRREGKGEEGRGGERREGKRRGEEERGEERKGEN